MFYKQLEELITMDVKKILNKQWDPQWRELKIKNRTIYGVSEFIYDKKAAILKEDLNSFFNFRLVSKLALQIKTMFTIHNNVKSTYINPYMQNKIIHQIDCQSLLTLLPEHLNKHRVYLICKTNSITGVDYGYHTEDNKLVLLNTLMKDVIIPPPKIVPINESILNLQWKIVEYELLENPYQILCKLQLG